MVILYRGHTMLIEENIMTVRHNASGIVNLQTKVNSFEDAYCIVDNHINNSLDAANRYERSLRMILTGKQFSQYNKQDKRF